MARQVARTNRLSIGEPSFIASAAAYWESKGDRVGINYAQAKRDVEAAKALGLIRRASKPRISSFGKAKLPDGTTEKKKANAPKITALREKHGLTKSALSRLSGISINVISSAETDDSKIKLESQQAVLDWLKNFKVNFIKSDLLEE